MGQTSINCLCKRFNVVCMTAYVLVLTHMQTSVANLVLLYKLPYTSAAQEALSGTGTLRSGCVLSDATKNAVTAKCMLMVHLMSECCLKPELIPKLEDYEWVTS